MKIFHKIFLLFGLLMSMVFFIAVGERFLAAVWMLHKFNYDWSSPVYLNSSTTFFYIFIVAVLVVANKVFLKSLFNKDGGAVRCLKITNWLHFSAIALLLLMLVSKIAILYSP